MPGRAADPRRMRLVVLAAGNGARLRAATGGAPKQLVEIGGSTLLDHLLDLGRRLDLEPLLVVRRGQAAAFRQPPAPRDAAALEVLEVAATPDMLSTLRLAGSRVTGDFVWVGGDTLFPDPEPLRRLLRRHRAERPYASYLCRRSDRHLAKLLPSSPLPRVTLTRVGDYPFSLPNFGIQCAASFADLDREPRGEFVQRALDRGERVLFQEYAGPVFEIDTPAELLAARRYLACASTC